LSAKKVSGGFFPTGFFQTEEGLILADFPAVTEISERNQESKQNRQKNQRKPGFLRHAFEQKTRHQSADQQSEYPGAHLFEAFFLKINGLGLACLIHAN